MLSITSARKLRLIAFSAVTLLSHPVFGQGYPRLSSEQFAQSQARMAASDKRSNEIFASQLPEIEQWSKRGKPYIPWAEKPEDLPQATIPAFPGAQGGGMFSFGGRGGSRAGCHQPQR